MSISGGAYILQKYKATPRVLFYHGVDPSIPRDIAPENFRPAEFERQMIYLKSHYEIISLESLTQRIIKKSLSGKEVVITLDDGYANNLQYASAILGKLSIPYTIFVAVEHVITGEYFPTSLVRILTYELYFTGQKEFEIATIGKSFCLNNKKDLSETLSRLSHHVKTANIYGTKKIVEELKGQFPPNELQRILKKYEGVRPLTEEELIKLSKKENATIGSHCKYHLCLHREQPLNVVKEQLEESKLLLEQLIDRSCNYLSYPNGDYTPQVEEIAKQYYHLAVTTEASKPISSNTNLLLVPRIGPPENLNKFKLYLGIFPKR